MQRTSVDLPEPESPMMMKISPWRISRSTARTAPTSPAAATSAMLALPSRWRMKLAAFAPNSFQTLRQASFIGRASFGVPAACGTCSVVLAMQSSFWNMG
jgi:hypothetical protein